MTSEKLESTKTAAAQPLIPILFSLCTTEKKWGGWEGVENNLRVNEREERSEAKFKAEKIAYSR